MTRFFFRIKFYEVEQRAEGFREPLNQVPAGPETFMTLFFREDVLGRTDYVKTSVQNQDTKPKTGHTYRLKQAAIL